MAALPQDIPRQLGSSEFFCSNPRCVFHVRVGDPGVDGFGDWARLRDGTTASHRWMDNELLCDLCARAVIARR
jgi:hypothetical protein